MAMKNSAYLQVSGKASYLQTHPAVAASMQQETIIIL